MMLRHLIEKRKRDLGILYATVILVAIGIAFSIFIIDFLEPDFLKPELKFDHDLVSIRVKAVANDQNRENSLRMSTAGRIYKILEDIEEIELESRYSSVNTSRVKSPKSRKQPGIIVKIKHKQSDGKVKIRSKIIDKAKGKRIAHLPVLRGESELSTELVQRAAEQIRISFDNYFQPDFLPFDVNIPKFTAHQTMAFGNKAYYYGEVDSAIFYYKKAIQLDPNYVSARFNLATTYQHLENSAACDSMLETIRARWDQVTPVGQHYIDWYQADMSQRYEEAYHHIYLAHQEMPEDWFNAFLLGITAVRTNRHKVADETFSAMRMENSPNGIRQLLWWTSALHQLGRYEEELHVANRALGLKADKLDALASQLRALACLGRLKQLKGGIEKMKTLKPDTRLTVGQALRFTAEEVRYHGHRELADSLFQNILSWHAKQPKTNANSIDHALTLYSDGQWSAAAKRLAKLHDQNKSNLAVVGHLGLAALRLGDSKTAEMATAKLTNWQQAEAYGEQFHYLAKMAALSGKKKEAVDLLQKSIDSGQIYRLGIHRDIDLISLSDYQPFKKFVAPRE